MAKRKKFSHLVFSLRYPYGIQTNIYTHKTLKDRNVRGIQRTSQRAGRGQVSRKPKNLQALRKQATTETGSAEEKNHQSPPQLTAALIERDHGMTES